MEPNRERARALAAESLNAGDPTGWFDKLYQEGIEVVPWAELRPNPNLVQFAGAGKTALVVGCGLGDDAEQVAAWGFKTMAFDVSPTAIEACKRRFPESPVRYETGDVLAPPEKWKRQFDFVLESYTVQALPPDVRAQAIRGVASFVKDGGMLLVIARAREERDPPGEMPWPLTRQELNLFTEFGLTETSFEDYMDGETRRFRVVLAR
ncbi:MAG TPA: class I SAM-dependent methyltransferase [Bryobacteraceae bacterium]|nr:class I SAM-dependent methyltransferase [Bryobacteraceae bacterium]